MARRQPYFLESTGLNEAFLELWRDSYVLLAEKVCLRYLDVGVDEGRVGDEGLARHALGERGERLIADFGLDVAVEYRLGLFSEGYDSVLFRVRVTKNNLQQSGFC